MSTLRVRIGIVCLLSVILAGTPAGAAPPAPAFFTAADANRCGVIVLDWALAPGATGYNIYRGGTLISIAGPGVSQHLDYEMPPAGGFIYCVEAFDAVGPAPMVCDGAASPSFISVHPADWYNDVFPSDANPAIVGTPLFDVATAVLATGRNLAPLTGNVLRQVIPDNKVRIQIGGGPVGVSRVDMVFRVDPGPGNYCVAGSRTSGLDVPPGGACVPSPPGSFWFDVATTPGAHSSPSAAALHAAAPSGWSKDVWNSRQCQLVGGAYQSTDFNTGLDILPSGLFTPGTHVEYFFHIEFVDASVVLVPDTNCVMQAKNERSIDGHRWAEFSVLPDRWKDGLWAAADRHAPQPACILAVDLDDGGGGERVWTSVMDTIRATDASRYGAHNGWHAVGRLAGATDPVDVDDFGNNRRPDGSVGFVSAHLGSPGTIWDLYNVKGAQVVSDGNAGSLGSRAGNVPAGSFPPGPTPTMLRYYYRAVVLLTGNRTASILGPFADRSQNDVGMLQDFISGAGGTLQPRAILVMGSGFSASEAANHPTFLRDAFGANPPSGYYPVYAGSAETHSDLITFPPPSPSSAVFGVSNASLTANEVLNIYGPAPGVTMAAKYEDTGTNPNPKIASIFMPSSLPSVAHPVVTLLNGWNIEDMREVSGITASGRHFYHKEVFNQLLGPLGCLLVDGTIVGVGEEALSGGSGDYLRVRGNPPRDRTAWIELGLASKRRVRIGIYDLAGRLVRTLHDGMLVAGPHGFSWDGRDQDGRYQTAGVFFVRASDLSRGPIANARILHLR